ncbi:MAG: DUF423 domain-containing protein [Candidatus Methylacidiphilales bacterium]|nr:DUF423 domain-containing protein [Candidatus Methylacidiphilales bacterium]
MIRIAAVLGFLAVALGAFGAHGLRHQLEAQERLGTWETAVLYHLVHVVVILVIALARPQAVWASRFFTAGILIFSGTLYVLCLTGQTWLGAVTPLGGLLLLAGWGCLLFNKRQRS